MINPRKPTEQQKNQRALKIKNMILKQTHDIKLAESLSPITKNLEINEFTQKLGEVTKESNSEIENIIPQPAMENTPNHQSIEKNKGVIYNVELENT